MSETAPAAGPPTRTPKATWLAAFGVALIVSTLLAMAFGAEPVSLARAMADPESLDRTILLDVRLPRIGLAAVAGTGLAVVGVAFQALLRNPLAEPYILGVSGGAAVGATVVIALGLSTLSYLGAALVPLAALAGGLGATLLVYYVAREARSSESAAAILLAGVMVNSIASAFISFLKTFVTPSRAQQLLRWMIGFIDLPSPVSLLVVTLYTGVGVAVILRDAAGLNLLALGDETAGTLGLDVRALQRRVFFASSCVVGAIVSVTGLIGFVGLVVPHALRRLVGPDHRLVLPLAILAGAPQWWPATYCPGCCSASSAPSHRWAP